MTSLDAASYCRAVERYLCRRNGGHLVRIVGPAFEMVRGWADEGVPMSIVERAIDTCAERRESRREASRPLRIEFCDAEVRAGFQRWRRAVGAYLQVGEVADVAVVAGGADPGPAPDERPALGAHLTRASARLVRAAARLERSEAFRARLDAVIAALADVQAASKGARGARRDACYAELKRIDADLLAAARDEADGSGAMAALRAAAAEELAPWRARMPAEAWAGAIAAASDRLLRDTLDLPDLTEIDRRGAKT